MNTDFYLPRVLNCANIDYSEAELLRKSRYIVVLAEPGGGKTSVMSSLASQLNVAPVTANSFKYCQASRDNSPLVIDAFDELSKINQSGIYELLAKAKAANAASLIISSRSSEWSEANTHSFKEILGELPLVVRLQEFNAEEQERIFRHHFPQEDFTAFQHQVKRFDLDPLLPNPEFLKLFAAAYVESERHFSSKKSIFTKAVDYLAKESNTAIRQHVQDLSLEQKISLSSEVFTKLLLSGADGIDTHDATSTRTCPQLASLIVNGSANGILATRLFKPGDNTNHHRPIHKMVAEYCGARYLTQRIADSADPLTLPFCLAIIAPNNAVRVELRGLLGWMATLGTTYIQESTIRLDPYAVLANGDPSQLAPTSKRLLITQLKEIEKLDPYFRRGDFQRKFSTAGLFTPEITTEIKSILTARNEGHLRGLILELLADSSAAEQFKSELRELALDRDEDETIRYLANNCLIGIQDGGLDIHVTKLIEECTKTSLWIAADIYEKLSIDFISIDITCFFKSCSVHFSREMQPYESMLEEFYFIKRVINKLDLGITAAALNDLTHDFLCTCCKIYYECSCRGGASKIIGELLDHYFALAQPPFNPVQIWQWVENLHFHEGRRQEQSMAVKTLQEDKILRQQIIAHVFGRLTEHQAIIDIVRFKFSGGHCHSGLTLNESDFSYIADLAVLTENVELWAYFIPWHNRFAMRGPHTLRRKMRRQALENPKLMRKWAASNRKISNTNKRSPLGNLRRIRRKKIKQNRIHARNIKFIQENRQIIESGQHWGCLRRFANLVLFRPENIAKEFGEEALVRNALRNCLDFIAPLVPNMHELAQLQCASQPKPSEGILYAACIEIMRTDGNLRGVNRELLKALRTGINMGGYTGVSEDDRNALKLEVDRCLFVDSADAEQFIREYIEPQLALTECNTSNVGLLRSDHAFRHLRAALSIEWLERFPNLATNSLNTLFNIAVEFGDREKLKAIIDCRSHEIMSKSPPAATIEEAETDHSFWLVRAFCFLEELPEAYWSRLSQDKNFVLTLAQFYGPFGNGDYAYWPRLTPKKIEAILVTFFDAWPKVDLPHHWGTGSPKEEEAYRFLTNIIWRLDKGDPEEVIEVIYNLLANTQFADLHNSLKSILSQQIRNKALTNFEPPTPEAIVRLLDHNDVVTVEGLRIRILQELQDLQDHIMGGEFNLVERFYANDDRLKEEKCRDIIAQQLSLKLGPYGITITPEHHLKDAKRCDFTAAKMIHGERRLLVTEIKGQWHKEVYSAAASQLFRLYSIHPDAEQQGIYLVIWYGADVEVAARKGHKIENATALKSAIEAELPQELKGLIDVFVLDVSKQK
jgi:hypothetical protein